ncbi:MAG: hypothetical protein ACRD1R_05355 [Acidobacteriota bacterium]
MSFKKRVGLFKRNSGRPATPDRSAAAAVAHRAAQCAERCQLRLSNRQFASADALVFNCYNYTLDYVFL